MSAVKDRQINLRIRPETDEWLQRRAGGARKKSAFIRELIERERAKQEEEDLLAMFNQAAHDRTPEEREVDQTELERLLGAFSNHDC